MKSLKEFLNEESGKYRVTVKNKGKVLDQKELDHDTVMDMIKKAHKSNFTSMSVGDLLKKASKEGVKLEIGGKTMNIQKI